MTNQNYQIEQIRNLSFAELEFFLSLYRLRCMTDTAKKHGLTVPAASRILKKLRQTFDDPLFVRSNPYFLPTDRAHSLAEGVQSILSGMEGLALTEAFDPKSIHRTFRIAAVDNAVLIVLKNFFRAFYEVCPHGVLEFQYVDTNLFKKLEDGTVDVALLPSTRSVPAKVHERKLYKLHWNLCVRSQHPLANYWRTHGCLPISEISKYRKIVITNRLDSGEQKYSCDEINMYGAPLQEVGMALPYFTPVPTVLANTDLTAVLPDETAKMLKDLRTDIEILPYGDHSQRASFWTRLIWHERTHSDTVMQWFRSLFSYVIDEEVRKKQ